MRIVIQPCWQPAHRKTGRIVAGGDLIVKASSHVGQSGRGAGDHGGRKVDDDVERSRSRARGIGRGDGRQVGRSGRRSRNLSVRIDIKTRRQSTCRIAGRTIAGHYLIRTDSRACIPIDHVGTGDDRRPGWGDRHREVGRGADVPPALLAVTTTVELPTVVGVPAITPVFVPKERPGGKVPV